MAHEAALRSLHITIHNTLTLTVLTAHLLDLVVEAEPVLGVQAAEEGEGWEEELLQVARVWAEAEAGAREVAATSPGPGHTCSWAGTSTTVSIMLGSASSNLASIHAVQFSILHFYCSLFLRTMEGHSHHLWGKDVRFPFFPNFPTR